MIETIERPDKIENPILKESPEKRVIAALTGAIKPITEQAAYNIARISREDLDGDESWRTKKIEDIFKDPRLKREMRQYSNETKEIPHYSFTREDAEKIQKEFGIDPINARLLVKVYFDEKRSKS